MASYQSLARSAAGARDDDTVVIIGARDKKT
jgi:hypothetical protein